VAQSIVIGQVVIFFTVARLSQAFTTQERFSPCFASLFLSSKNKRESLFGEHSALPLESGGVTAAMEMTNFLPLCVMLRVKKKAQIATVWMFGACLWKTHSDSIVQLFTKSPLGTGCLYR